MIIGIWGESSHPSPLLNEEFIKCVPTKRIFASQTEPGIIANVGNIIRALRPMPIMSSPV